MQRSSLGRYSTSTALSSTHYKLVQTLENASSAAETNNALLACLDMIRDEWARSMPSANKAYHDLVLLLYARSQRTNEPHHPVSAEERDLFEGHWALPMAVMLAGGGGRGCGVKERQMGYRACMELFTPSRHQLKLLLINTIRSDLHVPPFSSKAELRWALALRAIASPTLATAELIPAVRERVLELLIAAESIPIRRLALDALLSLVDICRSQTPQAGEDSSLLLQARQAVASLLSPAPVHSGFPRSSAASSSSATSSSSTRRHSTRSRRNVPLQLPLSFLSALIGACSPGSPLHPVRPSPEERLQLYLPVLLRLSEIDEGEDAGVRRTAWKGLRGAWAAEKVLEALKRELEQNGDGVVQCAAHEDVEKLVGGMLDRLLDTGGEMANALLLSALCVLSLLPSSSTFLSSLPRLSSHLQAQLLSAAGSHPPDPKTHLFAMKALSLLPPHSWDGATAGADAKGKGKGQAGEEKVWEERSWRVILGSLGNSDAMVRKATLHLLNRVDPALVTLHYRRLLSLISQPPGRASSMSNASLAASTTSNTSTTRALGKARARVLPLLLETLPFIPSSSHPSCLANPKHSLPSPSALLSLLAAPELALEATTVLPALVLPVLEAFKWEDCAERRREFAEGMMFPVPQRDGVGEPGGGEGVSWRGNVVAGLIVAGTAQELAESEVRVGSSGPGNETDGAMVLGKALEELAGWLANEDGSTPRPLLHLLQEPFLFTLLRLVALSPSLSPSIISAAHSSLFVASRHATPDAQPLFNLALTCLDLSAALANLEALRRVGESTRQLSLAEFGEALVLAFEARMSHAEEPAAPLPAAAGSSSRLAHPPVLSAPYSAPLQYDRYASPTSSGRSLAQSMPSPPPPEFLHRKSAKTLEREASELRREREDRGGRGGRAAESLMGAGELALLASASGVGLEAEEEEEGEGEQAGEGNALGLKESMGGERDRSVTVLSGTSTMSGEEIGAREPPADLLIELEALDPFNSGGH
ncbi:hypothetical protein JCM21900_005913 [Sporobolomyces salmonicolor]